MRTPKEGKYILNLKGVTRSETDLVGAKAANLGELAGAGFPVPEGFVLTTDAFDQFLADNGFDPGSSPGEVASADFPEEFASGVLEGVADIGDVPLAVRSSGTAEDLPDASFAGQYETVLGVRGADALLQAVAKCWSSAFSERVRAYRKAQGQQGAPRMAVLIQRLVEADAAGVAFTANPVTGVRSETVVSAVRGLGERLVSGQATPDEWVVRGSEAICQQAPEEAIDAAQALAIAELARRVEGYFGHPQDIEWAIAGGKLYLLQARPVTALVQEVIEPVPIPVEVPDGFWEREATHAPQPWSPMTSSLIFPGRNRSLKRAFDEFGILLETLEMREIGGWEYTRLVPLGGKDRLEAVRSEKAIRFVRRWHEEWQPGLETRIAELRDVNLDSLTDAELDEHIAKVTTLLQEGSNIHFLFLGLGGILGELVFACRDLLGWDDNKAFDMLNGLSEKSTEPSRRLADLASMVQKNSPARSILGKIDDNSLERLTEADPQFGTAFHEYMQEYGIRALRYEMADPTLAESPVLVLGLIQDQLVRGYDPTADASALRHKRRTTVEEARAALSHHSSQDRERFERALAKAEESYPVREDNEFFTISAPIGLIRYGVLEMGSRMAERGQIGERNDVFFLEMDEARKAFREGSNQLALVRRRKGERAWVLAHPGPATYGKDPGPPPSFQVLPAGARMSMEGVLWYMERVFAQAQTRQAEAADGALRGIAASPGEYRGFARVVMDESEFGKVEAGDVLVCPITSPVWSVLFPSIGALVTDTGGILSHPAIIAREYRVPAVVATGRATNVLRDGQTVKVDGSAGTVEVLS
jgi:pyruvate,water dikinase